MTQAPSKKPTEQPLKGTIVLLTDFYSEYQKQVVDPLYDLLEKAGYGFIVAAGAHVAGKEHPNYIRKGRNAIFDVVKGFDAQGVILMASSVCQELDPSEIAEFIEGFPSIPMVCIGSPVKGKSSLSLENEQGMSECMDFLLGASENQTFAFVGGVKGNADSVAREHVFRRAIKHAGKDVDENLVVYGDFVASKAYQTVLELVKDRPDIDVIVCANDESAMGAVHALHSLGLSVPEDIRVTGFDDSADTTRSRPTISSVTQPYHEIAVRAVELLLDEIEHNSTAVKAELIKTEFIARESTLCLSQANARESFPDSEYAARSEALAANILSRLKRPATATSIPLDQLSAALFEGGCGNRVPMERCIEEYLDLQKMTIHDVNWWQNLASVIETHGNQMPNSKIFDLMQECLRTSVQRIQDTIRQWRIRQEVENKRIRQIYQYFLVDLTATTTEESAFELVGECLSKLGVRRAYLAIYSEISEQPSAQSRMVLSHGNSTLGAGCEQVLFNTSELLPESCQAQLKQGMLVAHSITSGELQFGYLMIEPKDGADIQLDSIVDGLGNALLHIHQAKQMNLHTEKLQKANERLFNLANYDELTQLPNRAHFKNNLQAALAAADQLSHEVALAFIDLDGFKFINDSLGHRAGDNLLKIVAERLIAVSGHRASISRLGGDEFTIVFQSDSAHEQIATKIMAMSDEILSSLASPYELAKNIVNVSASVGVAIYPTDSQEMEGLIGKADAAMYHAKRSGKNCLRFYTHDLDNESSQQLEQDQKMRAGLSNNEFYLVYQPKYCLADYSIVGAEALLRWQSDSASDKQNLPEDFLPIAEKTGFITQLDEFVLNSACSALKKMKKKDIALPISINLSAAHMHKPEFVDMVADCIKRHAIDPSLLDIEITESAAMEDVEQSVEQLTKLRELGVSIAIDDFGTGYSSLNYLKRLPVNALKIDQSFLQDVGSGTDLDEQGVAICKAIIALGRSLHYNVIAEGIEHKHQYELLTELGCHEGQGYYFSQPLAEDAYTELLLGGSQAIAV